MLVQNSGNPSSIKRVVSIALAGLLALNSGAVWAAPGESGPALPASTLFVESDPAGATVYVDGQFTGQTPLRVTTLAQGDHRVRLVKAGYLENGRVVTIGKDRAQNVQVKLTRRSSSPTPEAAAQVSGGGGGGGSNKKWIIIGAAAGGGAAAAAVVIVKNKNHAPTVGSVSPGVTTGIVGTNVTFTAQNATDPDSGDTLSFSWDFGDGGTGTGAASTHVFGTAGTFAVKVTVSDGKASATATANFVVKNLSAQWRGPLVGSATFNTVVSLTQSGANLSGTYADQFPGTGTLTGSVNASSRQVTFTVTQPGIAPFTFTGNPNTDVTVLTGTASGSGFVNASWTLTRQ